MTGAGAGPGGVVAAVAAAAGVATKAQPAGTGADGKRRAGSEPAAWLQTGLGREGAIAVNGVRIGVAFGKQRCAGNELGREGLLLGEVSQLE